MPRTTAALFHVASVVCTDKGQIISQILRVIQGYIKRDATGVYLKHPVIWM